MTWGLVNASGGKGVCGGCGGGGGGYGGDKGEHGVYNSGYPSWFPTSGYDKGYQGGSQGDYQGGSQEGYPGGSQGYQGGSQGGYVGGYPGGSQGGYVGGYPGGSQGYQGGSQGGYVGGYPGGSQGGYVGGYPGGSQVGYQGGYDKGSQGYSPGYKYPCGYDKAMSCISPPSGSGYQNTYTVNNPPIDKRYYGIADKGYQAYPSYNKGQLYDTGFNGYQQGWYEKGSDGRTPSDDGRIDYVDDSKSDIYARRGYKGDTGYRVKKQSPDLADEKKPTT